MSTSSPRSSGLWLAAGAAMSGVLLGGVAVYLGQSTAKAPSAIPPPVPEPPASLSPAAPAAASAPPAPTLAAAVASTWGSVVNLESSRGLGAGVVVDPSGIVLTNYHVIAEALRPPPTLFGTTIGEAPVLSARFANDMRVGASVLVADPSEDLAVLRLVPDGDDATFASAQIGSSAALVVGQEVFAVGNPFGLRNTVSAGIVSALDRTGVLANEQRALIQLDASINLGNSGGPLFNLDGELVGIVTARSEHAQGIAFALPMDHVRGFLGAVREPGGARSGVIGVTVAMGATLPGHARELGYRAGLVLDEAHDGGPAASAGLRAGDAIVALRGKRLDGLPDAEPRALAEHLQKTVRGMFEGEVLQVTRVRSGQVSTVEVEVGAASPTDQLAIDAEELLGITLDPEAKTPTVKEIVPGTQLSRYPSVLRGATIESIMGAAVDSEDALTDQLAELRRLARARGSTPRVLLGFRSADGESGHVLIAVR